MPRIAICYHFFWPDDVVSARHFEDLALGLSARGWDVTVLTSNRSCHDPKVEYPARDRKQGVSIRRLWRPALDQAAAKGRIANAAWVIARWGLELATRRLPRPDVVLMGTDPIMSVTLAPLLKRLLPGVATAHWCFDLYPEAAIADGLLAAHSGLARLFRALARLSYRSCDLIADLGPCMRALILDSAPRANFVTLVPWALVEPPQADAPDPETRGELFGDARLGLLYSGNFGRAHSAALFLALARRLRDAPVTFSFGVRGRRADELRSQVGAEDVNIAFAGFAPEAKLALRLSAADIHMASLTGEWTGCVVPSKFFGSLAVGRPVLFEGDERCALARWIREYDLGWVLTSDTLDEVADKLRALAEDPGLLRTLQERCHRVYHAHFARERVLDRWDRNLRALLVP